MATYTIIGGDQKEYSYITADNVRQWITEGRLNAQSMAKAESDAEWRQLAQFPEFADLLAPQIPSPIAPTAFAPSTNFLERDYELDIGDCVSRAWNLFKSNLGILIGSFLLVLLISMITGGVSNGILQIIMPKQSLGLASEITGFSVFSGFSAGGWTVNGRFLFPAVASHPPATGQRGRRFLRISTGVQTTFSGASGGCADCERLPAAFQLDVCQQSRAAIGADAAYGSGGYGEHFFAIWLGVCGHVADFFDLYDSCDVSFGELAIHPAIDY